MTAVWTGTESQVAEVTSHDEEPPSLRNSSSKGEGVVVGKRRKRKRGIETETVTRSIRI